MSKPHPLSLQTLVLAWSLIAASLPAAAAPEPAPRPATNPGTDNAQALMDQHCVQCHGSEVYTRKDRKVNSLDALGRQVRRCEFNLQLRWFDEDVQAVTDHLNRLYYRFKP
jgi:cytochrome c553